MKQQGTQRHPKSWGFQMLLATALVCLIALPAAGQEPYPRVELFGGFSLVGGKAVFTPRSVAYGVAGSASVNFTRWLGVTADVSAHYRSQTQDGQFLIGPTRYYQFLFGPRLVGRGTQYGDISLRSGNVGWVKFRNSPGRLEKDFAVNVFGMGWSAPLTENGPIGIQLLQLDGILVRREELPSMFRWRGVVQLTTGVTIRLVRRP